ncbi:MAG: hypothetical protein R3B91_17050 [Planctomycetaceae bacterium]
MKRWISQTFIVAYLSVLMYGVFCHTLYYKTDQHPAMYFIVWDMFCGWTAYETRTHVVGEGVSGQYYQLSPGPWGTIKPHSKLDRRHYDSGSLYSVDLAMNTLRQTQHEPMARLYVVEEAWPRKYNLPDNLWAQRYTEPKDRVSYYQLRGSYTPDGQPTEQWPPILTRLAQDAIMANPRLMQDMHKGKPFYAFDAPLNRGHVMPVGYEVPVQE